MKARPRMSPEEAAWWSRVKKAVAESATELTRDVIDKIMATYQYSMPERKAREIVELMSRQYIPNKKPRVKTFYVARFRPPHPSRGEFWAVTTSVDELPSTVVGNFYKISAPTRALALAEARAAHARGK
jgi:hypothetical protein